MKRALAFPLVFATVSVTCPTSCWAFTASSASYKTAEPRRSALHLQLQQQSHDSQQQPAAHSPFHTLRNIATGIAAAGILAASVAFSSPVLAENELSAKYGGGGLDTSLVDQTCLVDKCSLQAKACLADDPDCRKGLTCTAKCLGDNACITGCMARYGNSNLDRLLKCTIEDHECIKVAILPGGADKFGQEPRSPAPTVRNFDPASLQGSWYKVVGYNPNYDCYACQRNTFSVPAAQPTVFTGTNRLQMEVEFSMPHLLPDGSPPPPTNVRELIKFSDEDGLFKGAATSIGLNDYATRETMVFDNVQSPAEKLILGKGTVREVSYSRTAHSEGEMFGLSKFRCADEALWACCRVCSVSLTLVGSACRVLGELVCHWRERSRNGRVQVYLLQRQDSTKHL